jgi:hypothetical protein
MLKRSPAVSASAQPIQSWPPRGRTAPSTVIAAVLAVTLIVLATILVLNHGSVLLGQPSSSGNPVLIYVDGIDRNVTYKGNLPHYFGPTINDSCAYCPVGAQAGGVLQIPLATWNPPSNLSFWVFTNVSGPFLVQGPSCSPAPCTLPWLKVWSYETYVAAGALASMTLFATFQLPDHANWPNIVSLNATFCPSWVCTEIPS